MNNNTVKSVWQRCSFTLCTFLVAEDVSLTGGAATQRIRLIDEEEQVHCVHLLYPQVHSTCKQTGPQHVQTNRSAVHANKKAHSTCKRSTARINHTTHKIYFVHLNPMEMLAL